MSADEITSVVLLEGLRIANDLERIASSLFEAHPDFFKYLFLVAFMAFCLYLQAVIEDLFA